MRAKNFKPIKAIKPKDDLKEFVGKTLMIEGKPVVVETIVGSMIKEFVTQFEVNGEHHITILDAYRQLHGDTSITDDMVKAFAETSVEHIEQVKPDDAITMAPKPKPLIQAMMIVNEKTLPKMEGLDLGNAISPEGDEMPIYLEVGEGPADGEGHFFFGPHFMGKYDFTKAIKEKGSSETSNAN